jgi:hypothetical protein
MEAFELDSPVNKRGITTYLPCFGKLTWSRHQLEAEVFRSNHAEYGDLRVS